MRAFACLALLLALSGCVSDVMSDGELHERGLWTDKDAEARSLLDGEFGPGRPVRYAPYWRKFASPISAVETITGMRYDKRYYYCPDSHVYVFPGRGDRPPVIVPEDPEEQERPSVRP